MNAPVCRVSGCDVDAHGFVLRGPSRRHLCKEHCRQLATLTYALGDRLGIYLLEDEDPYGLAPSKFEGAPS